MSAYIHVADLLPGQLDCCPIAQIKESIERLLVRLRELVESHERVLDISRRVRFQVIGMDALEVLIFVCLNAQDFPEYLELSEDLNLQVMAALDELNITLAVPARELITDKPVA